MNRKIMSFNEYSEDAVLESLIIKDTAEDIELFEYLARDPVLDEGFDSEFLFESAVLEEFSDEAFTGAGQNLSPTTNPNEADVSRLWWNGKIGTGNRGLSIKALQTIVGAKADGNFGPETLKSVNAFQESNNLQKGEANPKTILKAIEQGDKDDKKDAVKALRLLFIAPTAEYLKGSPGKLSKEPTNTGVVKVAKKMMAFVSAKSDQALLQGLEHLGTVEIGKRRQFIFIKVTENEEFLAKLKESPRNAFKALTKYSGKAIMFDCDMKSIGNIALTAGRAASRVAGLWESAGAIRGFKKISPSVMTVESATALLGLSTGLVGLVNTGDIRISQSPAYALRQVWNWSETREAGYASNAVVKSPKNGIESFISSLYMSTATAKNGRILSSYLTISATELGKTVFSTISGYNQIIFSSAILAAKLHKAAFNWIGTGFQSLYDASKKYLEENADKAKGLIEKGMKNGATLLDKGLKIAKGGIMGMFKNRLNQAKDVGALGVSIVKSVVGVVGAIAKGGKEVMKNVGKVLQFWK